MLSHSTASYTILGIAVVLHFKQVINYYSFTQQYLLRIFLDALIKLLVLSEKNRV